MCGLAGFIDTSRATSREDLRSIVTRMSERIVHRGPDDSSEWVDPESGIALGFRRLAILDLTEEGRQPMISASGRYVIAFNGEVYSFREIRRRLEEQGLAPAFRGGSDTEVMLAAIEAWGLHEALQDFVGMFAFALWDRKERVLHLVRDRLGKKPLYYGWAGNQFLFGSELSTLRAHPAFKAGIDRDALALYMRHCYIPAPYSIYEGIRKLLPGTVLTISPGQTDAEPVPYWSAKDAVEAGIEEQFRGSEADALDELDALLRNSVDMRMVSDVPLGVFLSGGIDSSLVTALMQHQNTAPVKTFAIGFAEESHNEAPYASEVARHLGTDHSEMIVTPAEAQAVIPKLPVIYDEPFADSSQIPTYLVSQFARRSVTVSLSGDGGDELFGGYSRYQQAAGIWTHIGRVPALMRAPAAKVLSVMPQPFWRFASRAAARYTPSDLVSANTPDRLAKLTDMLMADGQESFYRRFVSHWKDPASVVLGAQEPATHFTDRQSWAKLDGFLHSMMYLDTVSYLPDDILVKVDRASMSVGLEARAPLLDHRVMEFAWRLPISMKVKADKGKWPLRQVLYRYVPKELIERPKMGFGVPISSWLRGPLRDWAESLLEESKLNQQGYLNTKMVRTKWSEHLQGNRNWHYYIWDVLMFQAWLENQAQS